MIILILEGSIVLFIFPFMSISQRNDDIAQSVIQVETVQYVDNIRSTGKITLEDYDAYVQRLAATGNKYDVEIEVKILDENPGKKSAQASKDKIGENIYYSEYTSQILEKIMSNNNVMRLKEGDIVSVRAKIAHSTIAETLINCFYAISGNSYKLEAQHAGVVMTNSN